MRRLSTTAQRQSGLSLVELMVAVVIGMLLLAGLLGVVTSSSRNYGELNKTSRQLENGRYALELLKEEIQHAGFYGGFYTLPAPPGTLPDPCGVTLAALEGALGLPLQGYNAPTNASALSCLDDADFLAGTDILVVRHTDTNPAVMGALEANRFYFQGTGAGYVLAKEDGDTSNDAATWNLNWRVWDATTSSSSLQPAPLFPFRVHIYFVSPCSVPTASHCDTSADGGDPIPTLKRLVLSVDGAGPTMSLEPLVEGIENLQFDYGIDADEDGSPDGAYTTSPASTTDWANVVTVRVNLLARNIEPTAGHTDTKTYSLGVAGTVGPANDAYKRHVYSALVRAVNVSSRREQ